jgi:hypothetical protein
LRNIRLKSKKAISMFLIELFLAAVSHASISLIYSTSLPELTLGTFPIPELSQSPHPLSKIQANPLLPFSIKLGALAFPFV